MRDAEDFGEGAGADFGDGEVGRRGGASQVWKGRMVAGVMEVEARSGWMWVSSLVERVGRACFFVVVVAGWAEEV